MSARVIENPQDVVEGAQYFTCAELGRIYGVSRQRIHQILQKHGVRARTLGRAYRVLKASGVAGKMKDEDVAVALDLTVAVVRNFRKAFGIPRFHKKVGCPRCRTDEYAKGLCRNCYTRERRNRGLKS